MKNRKLELLAPAGSWEKLQYAIHYGADAVYAGVPDFSMRYRINKFNEELLERGVEYARENKKKFYVTINIYPHNRHFDKIEKHLKFLKKLDVDAVIVSDPGVLALVKKHLPETDIHLSTQANALNWQAVKFWHKLGVKRVILAREVTLREIKEISEKVPGVELEYFVHGAMCMSYSGRCILSKWLTGRSANLGDCAQPCRWAYKTKGNIIMASVKDSRNEFEIDLEEDGQGTYFFNSKDLNLLAYLDELRKAGITSFKIEGRNKSVYYLAVVVRSYRKVLDAIEKKCPTKEISKIIQLQQKELNKLMHRGYTTGFLLGKEPEQNFEKSHEQCKYQFVGEIIKSNGNTVAIKIHNAIYPEDKLEILNPNKNTAVRIEKILNEDKEEVQSAHGGQEKLYYLKLNKTGIKPKSLIRKAS